MRKCLAKDPDERYQSLREAAIDLRDVRRQLESGPVTAITPAPPPRRRTMLIAAIAAAVVVAGVAIAIPLWRGRTPAPPAAALRIDRTTSSGLVIDAILSPDGKYLAYVESLGGKQGLWLRQVQGARPIELVPAAPVGFWGIAFAKDGQSIYYGNKSSGGNAWRAVPGSSARRHAARRCCAGSTARSRCRPTARVSRISASSPTRPAPAR